jgi:hypothetical protein
MAAAAFGLSAFAAEPALAQSSTRPVSIPVRVVPGDSYLMNIDFEGKDQSAGGLSYAGSATLALQVESMGPQGGVWRWSFEDVSLRSLNLGSEAGGEMPAWLTGPGLDTTMSATLRLFSDLDFVCRVDARGTCVELQNWPEWRERIENVVLITSGAIQLYAATQSHQAATPTSPGEPAVASPTVDMNQVALAINNVAGILLNAVDGEMLATGFSLPGMSEIQGRSFVLGAETPTEINYAMPFGAEPIRMTGSATLQSVDRAAGVARFSYNQVLDQRSMVQSFTTMVQNGSGPIVAAITPALPPGTLGEDPAASTEYMASMMGAMLSSFRIDSEVAGTAEVDLATGLVTRITSTQRQAVMSPDGEVLTNQVARTSITLTRGAPEQPRLGRAIGQ